MPHGERLLIPEPPEIFSVNCDGDDENDEHQLHFHSENSSHQL
jgi:hypothetical protein